MRTLNIPEVHFRMKLRSWYATMWYTPTWRYATMWYTRRYDIIWYDMIWYDMIWYDMIWYDMVWYDMIWYDMMWYDIYDLHKITVFGPNYNVQCDRRRNKNTESPKNSNNYNNRQQRNKAQLWSRQALRKIEQEDQLWEFAVDQLHIIWDWTTRVSVSASTDWVSLALLLNNFLPCISPLHGGSSEIVRLHGERIADT